MKKFILLEESQFEEIMLVLRDIQSKNSSNYEQKWISEQQLKEYLSCGSTWRWELQNSNMLPYTTIKGKRFYKISDIEDLLMKNYNNPNL